MRVFVNFKVNCNLILMFFFCFVFFLQILDWYMAAIVPTIRILFCNELELGSACS